jgi:hypothetical protein
MLSLTIKCLFSSKKAEDFYGLYVAPSLLRGSLLLGIMLNWASNPTT